MSSSAVPGQGPVREASDDGMSPAAAAIAEADAYASMPQRRNESRVALDNTRVAAAAAAAKQLDAGSLRSLTGSTIAGGGRRLYSADWVGSSTTWLTTSGVFTSVAATNVTTLSFLQAGFGGTYIDAHASTVPFDRAVLMYASSDTSFGEFVLGDYLPPSSPSSVTGQTRILILRVLVYSQLQVFVSVVEVGVVYGCYTGSDTDLRYGWDIRISVPLATCATCVGIGIRGVLLAGNPPTSSQPAGYAAGSNTAWLSPSFQQVQPVLTARTTDGITIAQAYLGGQAIDASGNGVPFDRARFVVNTATSTSITGRWVLAWLQPQVDSLVSDVTKMVMVELAISVANGSTSVRIVSAGLWRGNAITDDQALAAAWNARTTM